MPRPVDVTPTVPRSEINPLVRLIATGLYSGYSPVASGTAGSLLALLIYCIPGFEQPLFFTAAIAIVFVVGVYASSRMERALGEDPSVVVIDEVAGMWIALFLLPKTIAASAAAFLLFRIFDILKPPPARQSERLRNGWGIMTDDVIAGIYANLVTQALIVLFPTLFQAASS